MPECKVRKRLGQRTNGVARKYSRPDSKKGACWIPAEKRVSPNKLSLGVICPSPLCLPPSPERLEEMSQTRPRPVYIAVHESGKSESPRT